MSDKPNQAQVEEQLRDFINKLSGNIIGTLVAEAQAGLDKKTDEILTRAKEYSKTNEIIIAIKPSDKVTVEFKEGAHPLLPQVLNFLTLGLTPLLVGAAGCGKTFLGEQAAKALQLPYGHLCFSAGVSETWLFGRQTPQGFVEGQFSKIYREGGVFLADELDAADANLLLTINTALANGHMYNPISGQNFARHKDFHFIGTANTFGKGGDGVYTGRSRLDAATLDRFTVLKIDYLKTIEDALCPKSALANWLREIRSKVISKGSLEVVSYRMFEKAYKLNSSGLTGDNLNKALFASWPEAILTSCVPKLKG